MITKELVDYIKKQLSLGNSREKIAGDLLANGWNLEDAEEGFRTAGAGSESAPPAPVAAPEQSEVRARIIWPFPGEPRQQTGIQIHGQRDFELKKESSAALSSVVSSPFLKTDGAVLFGIIGALFFLAVSMLAQNVNKISLAVLEILLVLFIAFCAMFLAKALNCKGRTFLKALSAGGFMGYFAGLIFLSNFFGLPAMVPALLFLAGIPFTVFFLKNVYGVSLAKAFTLWLLYSSAASSIAVILFLGLGLDSLL